MIDIETLSVLPTASILTIGAIKFNRRGKLPSLDNMDTFYKRISLESCKRAKLHISEETIRWWKSQNEESKKEIFSPNDRYDLKQTLIELKNWIPKNAYVWAQGPVFDITILENAYKQCNVEIPWKFYNVRDVRTVLDICDICKETQVSHNALDDCFQQIKLLRKGLKLLRK